MTKEHAKLLLSFDPEAAKHLLSDKLEYPVFLELRKIALERYGSELEEKRGKVDERKHK